MTNFSKKWDKRDRGRDRPRASLFNWKLIIFIGIVLFGASFAVAAIFPMIYAEGDESECDTMANLESENRCYVKLIHEQNKVIKDYSAALLYINTMIYDQNEQIIEKIDWNNCVLDVESRYSYASSILILEACGTIP